MHRRCVRKKDDPTPEEDCDQAECQSQNIDLGLYKIDGKTYHRYKEYTCVDNKCEGKTVDKEVRCIELSSANQWWNSDYEIESLAQCLQNENKALGYEIYKNNSYIMILLTMDVKKEAVGESFIDIPVYKTFIFDLSAEKVLDATDDNRNLAYNLYLDYFIKTKTDDIVGEVLDQNDNEQGSALQIRNFIQELRSGNKIISFAPIAIACSVLGEGLLVAETSDPALGTKKVWEGLIGVSLSISEASTIAAYKDPETQDAAHIYDEMNKLGKTTFDNYQKLKPGAIAANGLLIIYYKSVTDDMVGFKYDLIDYKKPFAVTV